MLELECRAGQFADMAAWDYDRENVIECKVETMIPQAVAHFSELLAMGQRVAPRRPLALEGIRAMYNRACAQLPVLAPLPAWRTNQVSEKLLVAVVRRNAFHRKSGGRVPGETDPDHHYRSGVIGDWRNHFFPDLTRKFKTLYGDLLIKLGYEQNAQW